MNDYKIGLSGTSTRELLRLRAEVAARFAADGRVMAGRVVGERRACGKPNCSKCGPGLAGHGPYRYFLPRRGGRGKAVYVPAALVGEVEGYTRAGAAWWDALELLTSINAELLRRRELD
ncbi:MAG: hypothetical protein LBD77_10175 [Bifidobacteriaceae bacterium]|jgi:hypothetical protein|nr:hypothetical protein [Bifidobacteriaceae bacterium]